MRRTLAALIALPLLATACSSSGGSDPSSSALAPSGAAGTLATKVQQGIAGLTSAHLAVSAGALGGDIAADVTFKDGKTTGSDLTLDQGGKIEVITVDGTSYAKLPAGHNTSGKPWVKVSADSKNEFVRGLAGNLQLANAATSLGDVSTVLTKAAQDVKDAGAATVAGVQAEHYTLQIDPTKAEGSLGDALSTAGSKPLPLDLYLDDSGRPVRLKLSIPLGQSSLPLQVDLSAFNKPLTITAPPAGEISAD